MIEKQKKTLEEIQFNKTWGKKSKLWVSISDFTNKLGHAPKCNVKVKQAQPVEYVNSKKKK